MELIPDHRIGACCTNYNFLGSSRTYVYLANNIFFNTPIKAATLSNVANKSLNLKCFDTSSYIYGPEQILWKPVGDNSYINTIIAKEDTIPSGDRSLFIETAARLGGNDDGDEIFAQDRIEFKFEQNHASQNMSHWPLFGTYSYGSPLAWRDDGVIRGILSPLFVAGWINCFGQPCFDCLWQDSVKCGMGPEQLMNTLSGLIDNFYASQEYRPYNGFFEDWHGVIERNGGAPAGLQAEPITGWYLYVFFGSGIACGLCGYYDEYCGCCWFCFSKDCTEPFFIKKITGSSILTLNIKRGIPFLNEQKLYDFKKSSPKYNSNIRLTDVADEIIFFCGDAEWKKGDIRYNRYYAPWSGAFSGGSGVFFDTERGANVGKGLSGVGFGRNILIYDGNFPVQMSRLGGGLVTRDTLVINKNEENELSGSTIFDRAWIYVDIPEEVIRESSYITHTADDGKLPDLAYGRGIPWNPVGAFPWLNTRHKKLFVRSAKNKGHFMKYDIGEGNFFEGEPVLNTYAGGEDTTVIKYYKQAVKKIVKAPFNLYFKSGATEFTECKVAETLKNLSPGRYYFPNPAVANRQLAMFDPDFEDLSKNDKIYEEIDDLKFGDYFNTNYRQFNIEYGKKSAYYRVSDLKNAIEKNKNDLAAKFENAVILLGNPYSVHNSTRMEYGGEFDNSSFNFNLAISSIDTTDQNTDQALEQYLNIPV